MRSFLKSKQYTKSDWYVERDDVPFYVLLSCFFVMELFLIFISVKWSHKYLKLENQFKQVQQTHTHVWIMDEACSSQLTNSKDGILRIKLTK